MAQTQAGTTTLALAILAAGYLCALCMTPPNPSPDRNERHQKDRIRFLAGAGATITRRMIVTAILYHAVLTALPVYAPHHLHRLCPRPENVNPELFQWSAPAIGAIVLICLGALIRLAAYKSLSRNFTFHLAAPDQLVTTGIYGWVQHPSYTGMMMIIFGLALLVLRWDAALACFHSEAWQARLSGWGWKVVAAGGCTNLAMWFMRMKDEEEMLRGQFGKEWEVWHRSTKRIIPGIF
ncbi:hypothetical protein POX_f07618 [Penicillium oxalicum]|uniref:Uncharacterized protein n=1 Tax=Penicillium oxalicum (strain 114-2 / CGMCC 5302) TaxID=933388 RepID=S8ARA0_PENO1|nr:hypothetical protein POX_f07618 [Penicillium oxalicum]EPS28533.1 hypothetical protein PDE_03479 [Penicillium oxalicum 114-2]KAI2787255.1 hypothetical protein POX_f07618 [Penicillium oxalicum]